MMPPINAVRKIAFGITFSASLVSSDSELIPSKPRNEKHKMVAPVIIGTTCAFSDQNGRLLISVPAPSPCEMPFTTRNRNTIMIATCTTTIMEFRFATSLMPRRLKIVIRPTSAATKIHEGTPGKMASR
ncbi:hypothetical protein D3C71_1566140 [compost metagenome]